jgi:hypothetical protein
MWWAGTGHSATLVIPPGRRTELAQKRSGSGKACRQKVVRADAAMPAMMFHRRRLFRYAIRNENFLRAVAPASTEWWDTLTNRRSA